MTKFDLRDIPYLARLGCVVWALCTHRAGAEGAEPCPSVDDPVVERECALLEQGYGLRQSGKDAEALAIYRDAYALRHDTKPLAQMGLAAEALGKWTAAHQLLRQALEDRTHPWIQKNRQLLQEELGRIDTILGRLVLVVEPVGAAIEVNGVPVGTAPMQHPLLLDPGSAILEVKHAGFVPLRRRLDIQQGARQELVLRLEASRQSDGPRAPNLAHASSPSVQRAKSVDARGAFGGNPIWIGSAIAGAAIALGAAVPWSIASRKLSQLAQACRTDTNCDYAGESKEIRQLDVITNVMLFSGVGVAMVSTVFYLTSLREKAPDSARLSTWIGPHMAGVTYLHQF